MADPVRPLLQAVCATPADDNVRRRYADAAAAAGDDARAEFVRHQLTLAGHAAADPACPRRRYHRGPGRAQPCAACWPGDPPRLARCDDLLAVHATTWTGLRDARFAGVYGGGRAVRLLAGSGYQILLAFSRGFAFAAQLAWEQWTERARTLAPHAGGACEPTAQPLERVALTSRPALEHQRGPTAVPALRGDRLVAAQYCRLVGHTWRHLNDLRTPDGHVPWQYDERVGALLRVEWPGIVFTLPPVDPDQPFAVQDEPFRSLGLTAPARTPEDQPDGE